MDSDTLVEQQIDEGQKLIEKLLQHGFEVSAAFWLKASEDGKWRYYLVAPAVDVEGLVNAAKQLHPVVYSTPRPVWINPLEINLIGPSHPLAKDVIAIHDRTAGPAVSPIRYVGNYLGDTSIEDAYLYPVPAAMP
jgi:hypothetical protein